VRGDARLVDDRVFGEAKGTGDALKCAPAALHQEPPTQQTCLGISTDMERCAIHEEGLGCLVDASTGKDLIAMIRRLKGKFDCWVIVRDDNVFGKNFFKIILA
jgi:hypothetical protein